MEYFGWESDALDNVLKKGDVMDMLAVSRVELVHVCMSCVMLSHMAKRVAMEFVSLILLSSHT